MASNSDSYHEPFELLSSSTRDMHRALVTVMEELEAIDWYQQRAEACTDEGLKQILLHNKEEEMEHASMSLEWIRRNSPPFNEKLKTYLFTEGPITKIEEQAMSGGSKEGGSSNTSPAGSRGSLGIGSLNGRAS